MRTEQEAMKWLDDKGSNEWQCPENHFYFAR